MLAHIFQKVNTFYALFFKNVNFTEITIPRQPYIAPLLSHFFIIVFIANKLPNS